ncbi:tRNA (cytidine(34)-2'-O)-methyltransferase [Allohahella marinimesophila]|uniref:tRNA (cytidine(34)-2'-O)-methyltransferase n=1 Tax=Allohahella marinimesophila TaxID=1054972 RepID=A0ABP7Q048_9GAMM
MFHIALYEPQIAPNTGNIMRLAANNGCRLHIIGRMGFVLEERKLRRAGLDYTDLDNLTIHRDFESFQSLIAGNRLFAITTKGSRSHSSVDYHEGDVLLFGSETSGLPPEILQSLPEQQRLRIPMMPNNRSLNLSNAVAIVTYEAWRQFGFTGAI